MQSPLRILAAVSLALGACASGPSLDRAYTVAESDAIAVVYEQQTGLRQTLLTEGVIDARTLYSSDRSDPLAKIMSTGQMQVLLDTLATLGFFDHARVDANPSAVSAIRCRINQREQVWSRSPSMSLEEMQSYHRAMAAFQNIYNQTESFHTGRSDNSVLDEAERIRRRNEAARRKAIDSSSKGQP